MKKMRTSLSVHAPPQLLLDKQTFTHTQRFAKYSNFSQKITQFIRAFKNMTKSATGIKD